MSGSEGMVMVWGEGGTLRLQGSVEHRMREAVRRSPAMHVSIRGSSQQTEIQSNLQRKAQMVWEAAGCQMKSES